LSVIVAKHAEIDLRSLLIGDSATMVTLNRNFRKLCANFQASRWRQECQSTTSS